MCIRDRYIIDLCTELDGLGFLASDDGTYIMTVNADDAVILHWRTAGKEFDTVLFPVLPDMDEKRTLL